MIDAIAQIIGYIVLWLLSSIAILWVLFRIQLYVSPLPSADGEEIGEWMAKDIMNNGLEEMLEEMFATNHDLNYEPSADGSVHWEGTTCLTEDDIWTIRWILRKNGYYIHPFPQDPDMPGSEGEWQWSSSIMGIWTEEPTWYVEDEDGERTEVKTDISSWEIDANGSI